MTSNFAAQQRAHLREVRVGLARSPRAGRVPLENPAAVRRQRTLQTPARRRSRGRSRWGGSGTGGAGESDAAARLRPALDDRCAIRLAHEAELVRAAFASSASGAHSQRRRGATPSLMNTRPRPSRRRCATFRRRARRCAALSWRTGASSGNKPWTRATYVFCVRPRSMSSRAPSRGADRAKITSPDVNRSSGAPAQTLPGGSAPPLHTIGTDEISVVKSSRSNEVRVLWW